MSAEAEQGRWKSRSLCARTCSCSSFQPLRERRQRDGEKGESGRTSQGGSRNALPEYDAAVSVAGGDDGRGLGLPIRRPISESTTRRRKGRTRDQATAVMGSTKLDVGCVASSTPFTLQTRRTAALQVTTSPVVSLCERRAVSNSFREPQRRTRTHDRNELNGRFMSLESVYEPPPVQVPDDRRTILRVPISSRHLSWRETRRTSDPETMIENSLDAATQVTWFECPLKHSSCWKCPSFPCARQRHFHSETFVLRIWHQPGPHHIEEKGRTRSTPSRRPRRQRSRLR